MYVYIYIYRFEALTVLNQLYRCTYTYIFFSRCDMSVRLTVYMRCMHVSVCIDVFHY